jgi:hypothetical protein
MSAPKRAAVFPDVVLALVSVDVFPGLLELELLTVVLLALNGRSTVLLRNFV